MHERQSKKKAYHHGNLAESLLDAVDQIASQFGLESVTLRGCAKLVGVSPSSAFRHYVDKRALLTAFATRALLQLSQAMLTAREQAEREGRNTFSAVGLAYVAFALEKPAFFRAMWREETIYSNDDAYVAAARELAEHLHGGFANTIHDHDPQAFSPQELLAWSSVHGLANLYVDGPVAKDESIASKLSRASDMIAALERAFG